MAEIVKWANGHSDRARAERDTLRRYLIERAETLRTAPSSPARDTELAQLEGWIRWLRGAI